MTGQETKATSSEFTLRIGCLGYFNYVVAEDGLDVVAVEVPTWTHAYGIWINGELYELADYEVSIGLPDGPVTIVAPDLVDGEPSAGLWANFNLVPRFADMSSGASLAPDWRERPSVLSRVRLTGGQIVGVPCSYSTETIWWWNKAQGATHKQPITHAVLYSAVVREPVNVTLTPRTGGAPPPLRVGPNGSEYPEIVLTGSPIGFPDSPSASEESSLDSGHFYASLSLCDMTSGTVTWHSRNATPHEPKGKPPKNPDCSFGVVNVARPTKVDCSPRVFYEVSNVRAKARPRRR